MGRPSRKKKKQCEKTTIMGPCGEDIVCNSCGYSGPAGMIESNHLGSGSIERCPLCRSLNFCTVEPKEIQLAFNLEMV